ncbi:MAG: hypothetical protein ABEI54_03395, partial [Candidatus Bipolaricaulia bacterium]
KDALQRIENLERELEEIKRDLIKSLARGQGEEKAEKKPSLFGSVSGANITDETIQDSKSRLFRDMKDI